MAEFVMKHLVKKAGREGEFRIDSKATSTEELGNGPHPGTVRKLCQQGIPVLLHRASKMERRDYEAYDYIIGMDSQNARNIERIAGGDSQHKIHLLLDFTSRPGEIADPWYTHNFDETYNDILEGCKGLLQKLTNDS